ncbi:MAG: hypothetical protein ACE5JP_15935 [Candidatus Bipolaricaulia bacterium]
MTTATKEKTFAQKTLEAIPEILKTTSMADLVDCGLESGGIYLADVVFDEEYKEKQQEYVLRCNKTT